jgi:MoaA/NifB/PqqE/SkfB family radical SAM enzyme
VEAIKQAKAAGFRVMTNSTFFNTDSPQTVIDVLDYLNDELKVDNMQISPGYAYEKAPDQDHWLAVNETRELFAKAFGGGRRKKWRLNHSPVFLDFLEGKRELECTPWGIPSYSLLGWQRPTDTPRPTRNSSRPPTGTSSAVARTSAARTAWPIAGTSQPRSSPRSVR